MLTANVSDRRRVQDLENGYQGRSRKFSEMPDKSQFEYEGQFHRLVNGSGVFLIWREGQEVYQVQATKVG